MIAQVKVHKVELMKKVKANREQHHSNFLKAQEEFRQDAIKALDDALARAKSGGNIKLRFELPFPEEHTNDYDTAIRMLEMSVDDEIELHEHEFRQLVCDEWEWARSFAQNTMTYATKHK